ncbi:MAG: hypothetical protein KBA26_02560 [Candidatus Delongbacteria bacterium]|nr:hypothetical protein [Candidatus Delongbacteria bacterium]
MIKSIKTIILIMSIGMTIPVLAETYPVKSVKGDVKVYNEKSQSWEVTQEKMNLTLESMIRVENSARLTLKSEEGEMVIPGPFQGVLGQLLSNDSKFSGHRLQDVFERIPNAKPGDKKIEITIQSAAMVKGAKSEIKQTNYRWRSSLDTTHNK